MAPDGLGLSSYSSFSLLFALISLLPHIRKQNPHCSSSFAASLHHQEESTLLGAGLGFNFIPDYSNAHVCTPDVNQSPKMLNGRIRGEGLYRGWPKGRGPEDRGL